MQLGLKWKYTLYSYSVKSLIVRPKACIYECACPSFKKDLKNTSAVYVVPM